MERSGETTTSVHREVDCEGCHCLLRRAFIGGIAVVLAIAVLSEINLPGNSHVSLEPGYMAPATQTVPD